MKNNAKEYSKLVKSILPTITDYLSESQDGNGHVLNQKKASDLAQELNLKTWIKEGGLNESNLNPFLAAYLKNSQHLHHPRYIGHQVSSNHFASSLADLVQGAVNNPMAIYEMVPSAAVIEQTIINWMLQKSGWLIHDDITNFDLIKNNGGGVLTHGGSIANLTAMLAARARISPDSWTNGTPNNLCILGSEVAHYSIARAVSIMGIGKSSLKPVRVNKNEVLIPDDLPRVYKEAKEEGKSVMAVIANACATSTGLYDPVEEIGLFCKENNLWFHIDGAHGASALLHEKTRHYLNGIEYADSMIWDTHKMLRTTTLCAAVLFKNVSSLHHTFQQKGSYLFHEKEQLGFDLMPFTVECTKAAIGTKLMWVLAAEGEEGIANYVLDRYEATNLFYQYINSQPDFNCPYSPEANILCFRYTEGEISNDYQLHLRNEIVSRGKFYITSTEVGGIRYLRLTVINALTTIDDIKALLEEIRNIVSN